MAVGVRRGDVVHFSAEEILHKYEVSNSLRRLLERLK
jgi:hypothetical protein